MGLIAMANALEYSTYYKGETKGGHK
ncbi:uncharacterized protein G2W53_026839 [Senna tora]|uniref:Uncharacterized protein n=1 Tax=Senna tora TaxID=362788 RepID=A0A834TPT4_9FABA|nr:uncharacterized protein G2W53_026839 [Senna tora]